MIVSQQGAAISFLIELSGGHFHRERWPGQNRF